MPDAATVAFDWHRAGLGLWRADAPANGAFAVIGHASGWRLNSEGALFSDAVYSSGINASSVAVGHWLRVGMFQGRLLAWRNPSTDAAEPSTGWVALGTGASVPDDLVETGVVRAGIGSGRSGSDGAVRARYTSLRIEGRRLD